jgi:type I restriction enzyme M protein
VDELLKKHEMTEEDIKLRFITPAIECKWDKHTQIRMEQSFTDGFDNAKKYSVKELADRNYNIDICGFPHEEEEILPPHELIQQYQKKRASLNADIDCILGDIEGILGVEV